MQEVLACPEDGVALPWSPGWSGKLSSAVYFCPRGCGTAFCSEDCYEIANREHHDLLCVAQEGYTEDSSVYKLKVLTLEHGLLIYDLAAQVVVHLAKQSEEDCRRPKSLPFLVAEQIDSLLPFWDYAADFEHTLSDCYRESIAAHEGSVDRSGWASITEECWDLLMSSMEERDLPGAPFYRSKGHAYFAKIATWLDIHSISVDHLSPASRYVKSLLRERFPEEILEMARESSAVASALEVALEALGEGGDVAWDAEEAMACPMAPAGADTPAPMDAQSIESLRQLVKDDMIEFPGVRALVLWKGMPSFPHACKPSVALSFSPFDCTVEIQANHALKEGALLARSYCRDAESREVVMDFLRRNGLQAMTARCSTCKTREYLDSFEDKAEGTSGGEERHLAVLDTLGQQAFDEERYEDACEIYEAKLKRDERDWATWHKYGRALVNMDEWSRGYQVWTEAFQRMRAQEGATHKELETLMAAYQYFSHRKPPGEEIEEGGEPEACEEEEAECAEINVSCLPWHLQGKAFYLDGEILTPGECARIIEEAEAHAAAMKGWSTQRHYSVPTTDLPCHVLPQTLAILNRCLREGIFPSIAAAYGEDKRNLQVHDAFVIKYSMSGQKYLPVHTDQSHYSATIGLNDVSEYEGGGLVFLNDDDDLGTQGGGAEDEGEGECVVKVDKGRAFVFKGGEMTHGGRVIRGGTRYIIALFLFSHDPVRDHHDYSADELDDDSYESDS